MKLSIIIPIYNVELYLESCLLSVLNQANIDDSEIILVDDCGTDNSLNIAQRIVKEYSNTHNIRIISHAHNQGLSAARNTGIRNAKGDYIFFLDSDDELPENTIITFNNYVSQYGKADFFVGNYIIEGSFNGTILRNRKIIYESKEDIFNAYINNEWYVMACGKFINRDFLISNNLWFPIRRLHEDEYFSFHLAYKAIRMIIIQENVYIYKIRENSITTLKKRKNYIDSFWTLEHIINTIKKDNEEKYYDYLRTNLFRHSLHVSISSISNIEKRIILKWIKERSYCIKINSYTTKSLLRNIFIQLPPRIAIYIFKILNYYLKKADLFSLKSKTV